MSQVTTRILRRPIHRVVRPISRVPVTRGIRLNDRDSMVIGMAYFAVATDQERAQWWVEAAEYQNRRIQ